MNEERHELLLVLGLLLSVRLVLLVLGLSTLSADRAGTGLGNDATRFQQIATHPGTAYRDFQVEFPPVTYGAKAAYLTDDSIPRGPVFEGAEANRT